MIAVLTRFLRTIPCLTWMVRCICSPGTVCRGSLFMCFFLVLSLSAQDITEERALALFNAGERDRAREAFEEILAADPKNPVALYHLGQLSADKDAEQHYLRLLYNTPKHVYADDALLGIVQIYCRLSRHSDAVKAGNRLMASYPDTDRNDQARYWLGRALLGNNQPKLARLTFLQLLTVNPQTEYALRARLGIAETYMAEASFVLAARAYLKMEPELRESDTLRIVLYRAGQCLEAAGKAREAGQVYQRLMDRFPGSDEARRLRDGEGN